MTTIDVLREALSGVSPAAVLITLLVTIPILHQGSKLFETWLAKLQLFLIQTSASSDDETRQVTGIFTYPIKSLRAVEHDRITVDQCGLAQDRRFMLVVPNPPPIYGFSKNDATHRFVTQRQCPELATVNANYIDKDQLQISDSKEGSFVNIHVKVDSILSEILKARIWDKVVDVVDMGNEAAAFFQKIIRDAEYNGIRLVQIVSPLEADGKYVPPEARTFWGGLPKVALSDGFPILVACEASLEEINRRLKEKGKDAIPMSRFRPNIVIKNTIPFEEDNWKVISIGKTHFHIVKGCPRCKQSCTDQLTGEVHDEPVNTLSDFRAVGRNKEDVYFAQNAIAYGGLVTKGSEVTILRRGNPVWDKEDVKAE